MREKGSSNYHTKDDSYEIDEIECMDCGTSFKNYNIYEILMKAKTLISQRSKDEGRIINQG